MYLTDDMPSIVDVLRHYGADMSRTSGQVNIRCPFHDDTHKSSSFNTRENIFKGAYNRTEKYVKKPSNRTRKLKNYLP